MPISRRSLFPPLPPIGWARRAAAVISDYIDAARLCLRRPLRERELRRTEAYALIRRGLDIAAARAAARTPAYLAFAAALEANPRYHDATASAEDLSFYLAVCDNPLLRLALEQPRSVFARFCRQPFGRSDFAARSFPFHRMLH